jgi:hypothetical protein
MAIKATGLCQWNESADFSNITVPFEITGNFTAFLDYLGDVSVTSIKIRDNSDSGERELVYVIEGAALEGLDGELVIHTPTRGFEESLLYTGRFIDFGEAGVDLPETLVYQLTALSDVDKDAAIKNIYTAVSGKWQWNDTIGAGSDEIKFCLVTVNNFLYMMIMFGAVLSESNRAFMGVAVSPSNETIADVLYVDTLGWIKPITTSASLGTAATPLPQTAIWDFGSGSSYLPNSTYEFLAANATPIS